MVITSLENPKIKKYLKLKIKKYQKEMGLFIVDGKHLVDEAYKRNLLVDLLVLEGYDCDISFPYTVVSMKVFEKISNLDSPSNLIGIVKMPEELEVKGNKVLVLDDIQDPGNLGTILRSSVAFGVEDIVLSPSCVDIYNEKVIRASQGMIFQINIIRRDLLSFLPQLKQNGYMLLGTNVKEGIDVSKLKVSKFALLLGNEGHGVKPKLASLCDQNVYIKMKQSCESLNVGVAASIILYEMDR